MHSDPPIPIDGTSLPRSIRWRLQLGVLEMPPEGNTSLPARCLDRLYAANAQRVRAARERYDRLVAKYDKDRYRNLHGGTNADGDKRDHDDANLDPLSMLVKQAEALEEQEAKDRKVRRASSLKDIVLSNEIVIVVNKDLNRLPDYHASCFRSRANWKYHMENQGEETDFERARHERNECLMQMLHLYGKEHVQPGYQQGMDEIFSYAMFVLEMDLFDTETSESANRCGLLSAQHLLHDSFTLAEAILTHLLGAFGVCDRPNQEPVEKMGESILQKIQYVARDKELYTHLQSTEWCLSLYTARWVRLLFAREVDGWRNTLSLWDIFFDCISTATAITSMQPTKYTRPGLTPELRLGEFDLMVVLEMTAASLIWMRREILLRYRADDGLQGLTAMDPLEEVGPLISTLLSSLRRLQTSPNMAPLLHPDEKVALKLNKLSAETVFSNPRKALTRMLSVPREFNTSQQMNRRRSSLQHISALSPETEAATLRAPQGTLSPNTPKGTMDRIYQMSASLMPSHSQSITTSGGPDVVVDTGDFVSPWSKSSHDKTADRRLLLHRSASASYVATSLANASQPHCVPARPAMLATDTERSMQGPSTEKNQHVVPYLDSVTSTCYAFLRQSSAVFGTRPDDSHSEMHAMPPLEGSITALEATAENERAPSEQNDGVVTVQNTSTTSEVLSAPVSDQELLFDTHDNTDDDGLVEAIGSMKLRHALSLDPEYQNSYADVSYTMTLKERGSGDAVSHPFAEHRMSAPIPVHEVSKNHRKTMDFLLSSASDSSEGSLFDL